MWSTLLSALKTYLDITDDSYDSQLKAYLIYAEDFIFEVYHRAIKERTFVEDIRPIYGSTLYTKYGAISSITQITQDETIIIDAADYKFDLNKIYLKSPPLSTSVYTVEYSVGYSDYYDIPPALRNVLFIIVKKLWNDALKDTDTLTSVSLDIKQGIRIVDEIPVIAQQTLETYRIMRL